MTWTITSIVALISLGWFLVALRRSHRRQGAKDHSVTAEALYQRMKEDKNLLLFDVRVPLDLLAHSEILDRQNPILQSIKATLKHFQFAEL